jgi:hypothetical protein
MILLSLCWHNKMSLPANCLKSLISQLANSCNMNTPTPPNFPEWIPSSISLFWTGLITMHGFFIIWLCPQIPLRGGHLGSASHLSLVQLTWELVHNTMALSQPTSEKEGKIGQLALPHEEQTLMGGSYITVSGTDVAFTLYPWPVWFLVLTTNWGWCLGFVPEWPPSHPTWMSDPQECQQGGSAPLACAWPRKAVFEAGHPACCGPVREGWQAAVLNQNPVLEDQELTGPKMNHSEM